jgi:hypothetical protein
MPSNSRWRGAALSMTMLAFGTCVYGYLQNARIEDLHAQLAAADAQGRAARAEEGVLRSQLSAQQHLNAPPGSGLLATRQSAHDSAETSPSAP